MTGTSGKGAARAWRVRRATEADVPTLGRLGAELLRVHYAFDMQRFMAPGEDPEGGYAWFLGTQLKEDDVVIFVAERVPQDAAASPAAGDGARDADTSPHAGGAILGYVYAGLEPQNWKELREAAGFVHDVLVTPEARGSGVGEALMAAAVAWLESQGAPRVMLWTAEQNAGAQRLFARMGFRRTMVEWTREL